MEDGRLTASDKEPMSATSEAEATEPKPEAKVAEPKPEANAAEAKPEVKAAEAKPDLKAAEPKPESQGRRAQGEAMQPSQAEIRNKIIFGLSILGILAALVAAYLFGIERKAQPPVFTPVSSPYESAIYANGIIESDQSSGSNINIYPEVSGPITQVLVHEGQQVSAGTPLLTIDDSVQKANTEQLRLQAEASLALLNELKAQPREETLAIAAAQVGLAESNLKVARDQYDKDRASYDIDPKSISKDVLDTAEDAVKQAAAGLDVARKQYELTKAGAWSYDIVNQEKQYEALKQAYQAANALLQKYSIKAPVDGVVLAVNATVGSYVSSQGAYNAYTQGFDPLVIMGRAAGLSGRALLRRRDPGLTAAVHSGIFVAQMSITRDRHQGAAGVRPGAALCFAQDRAIQSAPGESGPAGAAGDFPVPETGRPGLSGPAGGCIHRAEVACPAQCTPQRMR